MNASLSRHNAQLTRVDVPPGCFNLSVDPEPGRQSHGGRGIKPYVSTVLRPAQRLVPDYKLHERLSVRIVSQERKSKQPRVYKGR